MNKVSLRPMTAAAFEKFAAWSVASYAQSLIESGMETESAADDTAWKEFREAFPEGVDSAHIHCFTIQNEKEPVGVICYEANAQQNRGFILEFVIAQTQRRKGYGKAALIAVLEDAKAKGLEIMGLNVFHHNREAMGLYEACGFRPVRIFEGNSILQCNIV